MKCLRTQDSQNETKQERNNYEHDIWAKQQFISHIGKRITMKQTAQHIPVGIFQSWIQFFAAFHWLVARKTFSVDIPLIRVYPWFKLIRLKYLPSNEQSLNLVIKNWNNKCRPIIKKKVIFPPEFPFKWGQFSYLDHAN